MEGGAETALTLDQRAGAATEHEDITGEWIAPEAFLDQKRKPLHAFAHVGVPGCDKDPRARRECA